MIQTLNFTTFANAFRNSDRADQFSYEALELIFDYIEDYERDSGEKVEFDMIGLCCEWSELTAAEVIHQYITLIETEGRKEKDIDGEVEEFLIDATQYAGRTSEGNFVFVQF